MANSIANGPGLFNDAFGATKAASQGKEVWVTETGWPVSGPAGNLAEASTANAKTYWDDVGCETLFGKTNTWWYTLQDASPDTPSPSFGVVGSTLSTTPLYDLSCNASSSSSSSAVASGTTVSGGGGAATGVSSAAATASGADGGSPGISAGAGSVVTVGGTGAGGAGGATATLPGTPTNPTGAGSVGGSGSGSSGSGSGSGSSGSGSGSGSAGGNGTVTGGSGSPSASTTAVITNAAPANLVSFGAAFVALLAACMIL